MPSVPAVPAGMWAVGGDVTSGGAESPVASSPQRMNSYERWSSRPLSPPSASIPHDEAKAAGHERPVASGTVHVHVFDAGWYASTRLRSWWPSQPPIT